MDNHDNYRAERIVLEITREIFFDQDELMISRDPNEIERLQERIRNAEVLREMYLYELLKREGYILWRYL